MLYVNTNAIADALGVTPATVASWLRDGMIPDARIERGRWAIPADQAEAFVGEKLDHQEDEEEEGAWEGIEDEGDLD